MAGLRKILLVEDNIQLRDIYRYFLERHGYEVHTALNGKEALETARDVSPDLILLDIMMPEMDGVEALKHLRHDEEYNSTKARIVILTNLGDTDKLSRQIGEDADGHVVKAEIELSDLLDIIESFEK